MAQKTYESEVLIVVVAVALAAHPIQVDIGLSQDSFVGSYLLKDTTVCDELISLAERSPMKPGCMALGSKVVVDKSYKDSLDFTLHPKHSCALAYMHQISALLQCYFRTYTFANLSLIHI